MCNAFDDVSFAISVNLAHLSCFGECICSINEYLVLHIFCYTSTGNVCYCSRITALGQYFGKRASPAIGRYAIGPPMNFLY